MNAGGNTRELWRQGLWQDNPGLVQLLGLCPLLAVTTTFVNGFGLGLATLFVLTSSNALVSATRRFIKSEIRIPMYVLIISSLVTCIELIFKAWFPALDRSLGIFIPLIVTNCAIIGRAETFASRQPALPALVDGIATGLGFTLTLVLLGALRELTGHGTLLADAGLLFGQAAAWLTVEVIPHYRGFLLAVLPPGAFIGLGLLIAARNALDQRRAAPERERLRPAAVAP